MKDLIPQEKTSRKLCVNSAYVSGSWFIDIYDKIDVHNEKRVFLESITINSMLMRFYEMKNVKPFGIISAYIWDTEERKVIEYITDLPDNEVKERMRKRKLFNIEEKIKHLQQLKENLLV